LEEARFHRPVGSTIRHGSGAASVCTWTNKTLVGVVRLRVVDM
jgi:hypothetical protein